MPRPLVALVGGTIATPSGMTRGSVLIEEGIVRLIGRIAQRDLPTACEVIDVSERIVSPGFIDLQCNGALGLDLTSDPSQMWPLAEALPRWGVTSFLPTVISSPVSVVERAQHAVLHPPKHHRGARIPGLHLEGPFLNPARKGAHPARFLRQPSKPSSINWSSTNGVALVTLAPELDGATELTTELRERGVVVSAGHTDATFDDMTRAYESGVTMVTHLFNAMSPLGHRDPNVVGFALGHAALFAGLIADGVHVAPEIVRLAFRLLGPQRCVLVSDAVAALGMTQQRLTIGSVELEVRSDRVTTSTGVLAGSMLSLDQAVRNLKLFTNCSVHDALLCATRNPALALGRETMGVLREGVLADIVVLGADLQVHRTLVGGTTVFDSSSG